ncbi:MAG: hypothetical protein LBT10_00375 [Methanobrevibacter sp.]|nr:hypothetical protein [Methanobrevibacter sp.]
MGIKIAIKSNKEKDDFNLDVEIKWLFFKIYHKKISKMDDFGGNNNHKENSSSNNLKKILPLIKNNIGKLSKLLIVFIKSIELEKLNGNLIFGFYSPVTTAITFASINNIFTMANIHNKSDLNVGADFTKEVLEFNSEIIFKIRLLKPIFAFLRFITTKSGFELIKQLRNLL